MTARPPIIVIGMHRSGTTMVTRALQQLGLFVGWRRDPNNEALLFLQLNEWLLRQAGATWDNPMPVRGLLKDVARRRQAVEALRGVLNSWPTLGYLGPIKSIQYRTPMALTGPWGWKDPRNTLTYPLWLDLYPDAKILNVTRHGVDVANSLLARESQSPGIGNLVRMSLLGVYGRPEIGPSRRCGTIDDAFTIWEEYLSITKENRTACAGAFHQIKYEHFLANPQPHLAKLVEFCELRISEAEIRNVCAGLKPERAFAYRDNCELADFSDSVSKRLSRFDY